MWTHGDSYLSVQWSDCLEIPLWRVGRGREPWERSEAGGVDDNERHLRHSPVSSSTVVAPPFILPELLRGTRDRWVAQVSLIIINSTGLAPFPRLSAPPHSSQPCCTMQWKSAIIGVLRSGFLRPITDCLSQEAVSVDTVTDTDLFKAFFLSCRIIYSNTPIRNFRHLFRAWISFLKMGGISLLWEGIFLIWGVEGSLYRPEFVNDNETAFCWVWPLLWYLPFEEFVFIYDFGFWSTVSLECHPIFDVG